MKDFQNLYLGSRDKTISGERVLSKKPNLTKKPITFDTWLQFNKKHIFAIVFGNDVIMTSSVIVGLSN